MVRFLTTLAVIILIYYGLKHLFRLLFPVFLKRTMSKFGKQNQRTMNAEEEKKHEGEVNIHFSPERKKKVDKDKGDYVDFKDVNLN